MAPADLDGVVRVARVSFPDHFEDRSCFAERLALYPRGCFTLERDGAVAGYLIAYPWTAGSAPPLNALIHRLPAHPDLIYLHDLALHPAARQLGYPRPMLEQLMAQSRADGWSAIALVAVNRAAGFWQRFGFAVAEAGAAIPSYGDGSAYMIRRL
jgi:ribosomal protein S18 acetylase RimI-like enzyme